MTQLTKAYRLLYSGGTIRNADWQEIQTGVTNPGDGLSFFEADTFQPVQDLVTSLGLSLPIDPNAP